MRGSSVLRFWKYRDGKLIGRIESVNKIGLVFSTYEIDFRETSSNFAEGTKHWLTIQKEDMDKCYDAMKNRSNVIVDYNYHWLGRPSKGRTGLMDGAGCGYATNVEVYDKDDVKS